MIFKRQSELKALEKVYSAPSNDTVVFYGNKENNVHEIIMEFLKNKEFFYYCASICSDEKQVSLFKNSINAQLSNSQISQASYSSVIKAMMEEKCEKRVIVIEEFQNIIRNSNDLLSDIIDCCSDKWGNQQVLFILVSNNEYYIENHLLEKIGDLSYKLSGLIKVNNVGFIDIMHYFDSYSIEDSINVYSITGGKSNIVSHFDKNISFKDNIINNLLSEDCYLYRKIFDILPDELRELNVYNTILMTIASGCEKLNEIHNVTGYSRPKISVYLKNLADYNIIEKIDSFGILGKDNALKGIYRIKDRFILFLYKFIIPNISNLKITDPQSFYTEYIEKDMREFSSESFRMVCFEYLNLLNKFNKLPVKFTKTGTWLGKIGNIDIVCQDEDENTIIGYCNYEKDEMTFEDFEWLSFCVKQAKLSGDYFYLFSKVSFDNELKKYASENANVFLIDSSVL